MFDEQPIAVRRELAISKRDLLLFDHVLVMGRLDELVAAAAQHTPQVAADAEYLASVGFLGPAPATRFEVAEIVNRGFVDKWYASVGGDVSDRDIPVAIRQVSRFGSLNRHPAIGGTPLPAGGELVAAYALRLGLGLQAAAVMNARPTNADWRRIRENLWLPAHFEPKASLLDVVVRAMPVPGDDVPLEAILDFSRDEELRRRRRRLLLALARGELERRKPEDFSLQLREALFEFEEHMRLADMRAELGVVRLILSAALGAVEGLIHLRPKEALDAVFEYRKLRVDRLQAELHAPGGQVAYIYEAKRRFAAKG